LPSHQRSCSRLVAVIATAMLLLPAFAASAGAATLGGTVTGQPTKGEAEGLAGVQVSVHLAGSEEAAASTSTGADGQYALEVPSGVYEVSFEPGTSAYKATTVHEVEVKEARILDVLLASAELVHLTGTVRDASGEPIAGAPLILESKFTPLTRSETAADGSYSFTVSPGTYEFQLYQPGPLPGLPPHWAMQSDEFELSGDETRDVNLPAPSTLTVEALGKGGAAVPGATVRVPEMVGTADLGGYTTSHLRSSDIEAKTGADGRASMLVFNGTSCHCSSPSVSPPADSGYGDTPFAIEAVKGDTTVVVGLAAAGQPEGNEDVEAPRLDELKIEPNVVNPAASSQTVTLFAHITDDLSGFKQGSVVFNSPSGKQQAAGYEFKRVAGDAKGGTYEASVTFKQFSENGTWQIEVIRLSDQTGNERALEPEDIEDRALPHTVIVNGKEEPEEPVDTDPPHLEGLSIDPTSIDTSNAKQPVVVAAIVSDDLSGFETGTVTFASPDREQVLEGGAFELAGSEGEGTYRAVVTFPQGAAPGEWEIAEVRLRDRAGNEVSIPGAEIENAGLPHTVTVKAPPQPPVVTGVSPASGPEEGGTEVKISGFRFSDVTAVKFGSTAAKFEVTSADSIIAIAPPGAGTVDLTVRTSGGASEVNTADRFSYLPRVTLSSAPNPSVQGQKVTFTAQVLTGAGPMATGSVTFADGSTTLAVVTLNGKGIATFSITKLGTGQHQISATYSGDANHLATKSAPLAQVVNKRGPPR
jgi:hypothetical protein